MANSKYVLIVIFQNFKVSLNNIKRLVFVLALDLVLASKPSWKRIAALLVLSVSAQMMKWPLMQHLSYDLAKFWCRQWQCGNAHLYLLRDKMFVKHTTDGQGQPEG